MHVKRLIPLVPQTPGRRRGLLGYRAPASVLSAFSVGSFLSFVSILSIGSAGSILSIGSVGSVLSIGGAGQLLNRQRKQGEAPETVSR